MKRFLIVSLAVLFVAALWPQPAAAGVGLKGGLGLSKFSASEAPPAPTAFVNLKAPMGGVFFGINFGLFSIQPEILYVRMGTRLQASDSPDWLDFRLDYVQVPILLKISVLPGPISPMIYGGPYGAYAFSIKGVASGGGGSADLSDTYMSTDYGVALGGGLEFKLVAIKLSVEGRYNLGLANILKDPEPGTYVKNRCLMVLAGISF
jgi:hypothetical protein